MTTVLFVGDSITVGLVGVAQKKTDGASFRGPAATALGWTGVGPFIDPTGRKHGGIGGSTTYTFLNGTKAQFISVDGDQGSPDTWVRKYNPDVIHLMLGVNDIFSFKEDPLKIFDRLYALADAAVTQQKRNGKRGLVLISTICQSMFPEQVERARILNAKIASFKDVKDNSSIFGIPSAARFNEAIADAGVKGYTVDGTHPNQSGYDLIAASLAANMQPTASKTVGGSRSPASTGLKVFVATALGYGIFKAWQRFNP